MLLLVVLLFFSSSDSKRFPSYLEKCHLSNPNRKECYIKATETIRKHLKTGIPEFRLPPMNPLILPEITLDTNNNFKATFQNVQIFNIDDMTVKDLDINLTKNDFFLKLFFPELRIVSNYIIEGRLLFIQLNGEGPVNGNLTNVEADLHLQAHRYKKGQKDYLKFDSLEVIEKLYKPRFRFEGLFKNNPELTEQTNIIVNENIDEIINELRPTIHVAISDTILGLIGRIFDKYSVQELFPV